MDIKKALVYIKEAVKIAKTPTERAMCENAIKEVEKEISRQEKLQTQTRLLKGGFYRDYEHDKTGLKNLIRG